MRNPFAKPRTPWQRVLGSVCWTVGSISLWWFSTDWITVSEAYSHQAINLFSFIAYLPICLLVWWKGVINGVRWIQSIPTNKFWFRIAAGVWLATLIVFQIITSILAIARTVFAYDAWQANSQPFFA